MTGYDRVSSICQGELKSNCRNIREALDNGRDTVKISLPPGVETEEGAQGVCNSLFNGSIAYLTTFSEEGNFTHCTNSPLHRPLKPTGDLKRLLERESREVSPGWIDRFRGINPFSKISDAIRESGGNN